MGASADDMKTVNLTETRSALSISLSPPFLEPLVIHDANWRHSYQSRCTEQEDLCR
jgi:hypothetical protein